MKMSFIDKVWIFAVLVQVGVLVGILYALFQMIEILR